MNHVMVSKERSPIRSGNALSFYVSVSKYQLQSGTCILLGEYTSSILYFFPSAVVIRFRWTWAVIDCSVLIFVVYILLLC